VEEVVETAYSAVSPLKHRPLIDSPAGDPDVKRWLARELHDSVIQALSVMVLDMEQFKLGSLRTGVDMSQIERLQGVAREALASLRETIEELRGNVAADWQLIPSVSKAVAQLQRQAGIKATLSIAPSWPGSLPRSVSRNLYRIIEEALNNIRSHSGATEVTVLMWTTDESALVSVQDDGAGFEATPGLDRPTGGLGLVGMNERALLLGGSLRVESELGQGTKVTLTFPIPAPR
jgi:signal transduction histidine kinase